MISANTEGKKIAKDVGANGYLAKPFEIDDLLTNVNKVLGN